MLSSNLSSSNAIKRQGRSLSLSRQSPGNKEKNSTSEAMMKAGLAFVCVCFLFFRTGDCTVTFTTPSGTTATITLKEGSTTIYTAVATGTGAITYTTGTQVPGDTFAIGSSTGVITLATDKKIDYETATTYTVPIIATETAVGEAEADSQTATLTITVTDISSTPTFTDPPFCGTVRTGDASGKEVGTFAATVADPDETATYTFASGNTGDKFAISSAGIVTTTSAITATDKFPYVLLLKATASVTTASTATATLSVRDTTCSGATGHKSITMATVGTLLLLIASRVV